jgi:hypothetical protein
MIVAISDFKYAGRLIRKGPWFTLLTVLMIAGGLAISIYTFAIVNTMVYKDLPVAEGRSIVRISGERDGRPALLGAYEFSVIRGDLSGLTDIGVYRNARAFFGKEDSSHSVRLTETEWSIFEFTRTPPSMGRGLLPDDNREGAELVAVIGHRIWQSVFFGDPNIVGETARLNGEAIRIVGVMPEEYKFPVNSDLWVPLSSRDISPADYSQSAVEAYARLQPGTSAAAATTQRR